MESYNIPNMPIKQEQNPFITPMATTLEAESKYSQFLLGGGYQYHSQHIIPQQQETGIYFLPLEQVSNNSYKQQTDSDAEPLLFQKYPNSASWPDTNMYSNETGANFMLPPTSYLTYDKEKSLQKDDDILAQLLDEGGFSFEDFGNIYIPSNDEMLIPVQPPAGDPLSNVCYSPPQTSPMQSYPVLDDQPLIEGSSPSSLVLTGGENSDPLVSGFNEVTPSPNNEIISFNNETQQQLPVDNLQDLLGELFGEDDFTLSNSFSNTTTDTGNIIPITNTPAEITPDILTASFTIDEEDTFNNHAPIDNDMTIPSTVEFLPATKKPRMSNSSSMSLDDIHVPKHNLSSLKNKPPKILPLSLSPSSSPLSNSSKLPDSPPSSSSPPSSVSHKLTSLGGGGMLFGQHEDEIIKKLLKPQDCKGAKPITRDKLVTMPVEEFNALLDEALLTEIEVAFMKEWRRRGKNKMAAQIARKRKREELFELEDDMDTLRQRRVQLQQSVQSLTTLIASYKRRAEAAEKKIYKHYSAAHGSLVSQETHTIHVTDDGKTMLIPRTSNQVLLV